MKILCAVCSSEKVKTKALLPAQKRYRSSRILKTIDYAKKHKLLLYFLSGKFGLIRSDVLIPFYDKLLTEDMVEGLIKRVVDQLKRDEISHIVFYAKPKSIKKWASYYNLIEKACKQTRTQLEIKIPDKMLKPTRKA